MLLGSCLRPRMLSNLLAVLWSQGMHPLVFQMEDRQGKGLRLARSSYSVYHSPRTLCVCQLTLLKSHHFGGIY